MALESLQCKTLVLRVPIHCEGCKKKVKKVLQRVEGVYRCDVDAQSNKVTAAVTGRVSADALVKKLRRSGKHAEQWPEGQTQPEQRPGSDAQSPGETKSRANEPDKPIAPTETPAAGDPDADADAGEPSSPKTFSRETKKIAGGTAQPAQDSRGSTDADADGDVNLGGAKEVTPEHSDEARRNRKQQGVEKLIGATATAVPGDGGFMGQPLPALQQPAQALSYSVARPSASAAYYAAAALPSTPPARPAPPPPPQEYPYSSPYYYSQPSPYRFSYGHGTPPWSAASPARDSYSDLFSDDNANSCSVM
ncbi:hypothetical protein ACP70R_028252 [Stipagrostis hirtigluma subsp. patula]